jgi:hypothetical protein
MTMIGEYSEDHLIGVAKSVVEKKTKDSVVLDAKAEARIPKFESQGASVERVLFTSRVEGAYGGFLIVCYFVVVLIVSPIF